MGSNSPARPYRFLYSDKAPGPPCLSAFAPVPKQKGTIDRFFCRLFSWASGSHSEFCAAPFLTGSSYVRGIRLVSPCRVLGGPGPGAPNSLPCFPAPTSPPRRILFRPLPPPPPPLRNPSRPMARSFPANLPAFRRFLKTTPGGKRPPLLRDRIRDGGSPPLRPARYWRHNSSAGPPPRSDRREASPSFEYRRPCAQVPGGMAFAMVGPRNSAHPPDFSPRPKP